MSKLPLETRPLRLAPEVTRAVEKALSPLTGKKLETAQEAVLVVYRSGQQMTIEQWVETYESAIARAIGAERAAAA